MSCNCKNGSCSTDIDSKTLTYEVMEDDYELSDELERCYYEYNGLLQLVTQFTSTSPFKPDEERYNAVLNEYIERFIRYNLLFDEIVQMAVEDLNIDRLNVLDVSFSFIERTMYFKLKEEK